MNAACGAGVRNGFVHAVETAHECGFAAPGRSNHGRRMIGGRIHGDVVEGLSLAKPGIQLIYFDPNSHDSVRSRHHSTAGDNADGANGSHNKHNQDQRSCPSLAMPFIKGRNRVSENL